MVPVRWTRQFGLHLKRVYRQTTRLFQLWYSSAGNRRFLGGRLEITFRKHALQRMFSRSIGLSDVEQALRAGQVIREYVDDKPFPSKLILGWVGSRPLHIVLATNSESNEIIVITVYEPKLDEWEGDFKRRKK